ncbi:hypothetical protein PMIN06_009536 [Paraphaeosphaeria minitans]
MIVSDTIPSLSLLSQFLDIDHSISSCSQDHKMAPLKILISGGGIAGPCLAWWLNKTNVDAHITIIERAPEPRTSGQAVDIRGTAVDVMKTMGLEQAIRDKNTTKVGFEFVYSDGVSKAKMAVTGDDKNQSFRASTK